MALNERQYEEFVKNLEQARETLGVQEYNKLVSQGQQQAIQRKEQKNRTMGQRAADFAGGTIYGLSSIGRTAQKGVAKGIELASGGAIQPQVATQEGFEQSTGTDLDTISGKVGEFAGEMIPFAVGSGLTGTAVKGASLLQRALAQGGTSSVVQALESGDIGKDEVVAFLAGAGGEVAGTVVTKVLDDVAQKLPDWLVRPLVKQSATAKQQGKDIVPYLVDSGYVGSVDDILKKSASNADELNTGIQQILQNSDNTINLYSIADDVANQINQGGGNITADQVLDIVQRQAYQSRGILQNAVQNQSDEVAIASANGLRSQLDDTLYQGRDYLRNVLPENKAVLEAYTNALRGTVQGLEPGTQELFKTLSKEITLRDALVARMTSGGGKATIGLYDLVTGVGAFGATGDPVTTALAVGGRKAFEAPTVKTGLAKIFKNADVVSNFLSTASPAIRGAVLSLFTSLSEKQSNPSEQEPKE